MHSDDSTPVLNAGRVHGAKTGAGVTGAGVVTGATGAGVEGVEGAGTGAGVTGAGVTAAGAGVTGAGVVGATTGAGVTGAGVTGAGVTVVQLVRPGKVNSCHEGFLLQALLLEPWAQSPSVRVSRYFGYVVPPVVASKAHTTPPPTGAGSLISAVFTA